MGNGASSEGRAGSERPSSRPHSAAAGAPRKQHVLANQAPRRSANSFRSPAAAKAAEVSRQTATHNVEAKSVALQRVAAQRRAGTNSSEEEALRAFTRNADPTSLKVLQLLQQAETVPPSNPAEKLRILRQCYPLLEQVPKERFDQLAVTVYQQEGDIYYQQLDIENAKSTFSRAITLAEKRVARQDTDMYMVLKRYVLAMIGMARIWYDHERDHQGFRFVDHRHPKVQAVDGATSEDGASSLSSLESSLTSDGDSVFSLNEAILRSMAPRPPRRQTGPLFKRVKVKAPHTVKPAQADREEEFVLHSRMTRELVASPCELLLLRCCEVVQIGHNAQSELLIPPQIELAQIYEDLALYSRALLLVRRCLGILCSVYDYDHPWVIQLMQRADRLRVLLDDQLRNEMATKIQATWKMHKAMQALEDALGHPVKRHQWIPRKYRTTPDIDYLGDFVGDMPEDGLLGADETLSDPEDSLVALEEQEDPSRWAVVPQTAPVPAVSLSSDRPQRDASYEAREVEPAYATALVRYAPTEHREGGDTFTAMVPNANVVGTTQDTQTDTDVQHTDYGDVLTVRTTTVTKTITEDLARSDDEEEEEEEEDEDEESAYDEDPTHPQDVLPPAPPPLPTRREQPSQRAPPPLPPRPHEAKPRQPSLSDSPYADDGNDDDDYPSGEDTDAEEEEPMHSSPRDTSTVAQPPRHPRQPLPPQSTRDGRGKRREQPPPRQQPPPPPQQRRDVAVGAPRSSTHSTPSPPSPPPAPKPVQKTKQTQVQPRGQAAGTQTRSPPPPPPSQLKKQRQPAYSEVSVSSSTIDELPPPPPLPAPKPVQKTKQTQVQPRGQAAGTQTRTPPHQPAPSPPQSASPPTTAPPPPPAPAPPARRPSPMQRHVPPPPPPQRTTAGTQYDAAPEPPAPLTEKSLPPSSQRGRELPRHQPVVSPYTDDDIPSLVMREKPQRAAAPPQAPQKPQARPPQRPPSPVRHDDDDGDADAQEEEEEEQDFVEERRGEDATRPAPLTAPPRPYKPEVVHDSKREPFRDLVEPNERYPLDVNGAPVFLPPLPFRTGLAHNGAPQPLTKENGQLVVVRAPSRSGAPPQHGAVQLYDPRKIDANAQPGMPMTLPSPANGYPRQMQNAPLPQPQSRKVTRDHKIIKTRIVRTYRHDVASDSEDGARGEEEKNVFEHESGSSWETNGSVHWATSRSSSEDSGSARPITDAASSSSAATSPRKHPTTTSDAQAKKAGHATHTHTHTKAVTRRPKESSNGSTISPKTNGGGSAVAASSAAKKPSRQEDEAPTPEVISSSVAHHVKHNRRSRTTTTVRHLDDSTEL